MLESHRKKWARMDEEVKGFGETLELPVGAGWADVQARWLSELVWTDTAPGCGVSSRSLPAPGSLEPSGMPLCPAESCFPQLCGQDGFALPAKGGVCVETWAGSSSPGPRRGWATESPVLLVNARLDSPNPAAFFWLLFYGILIIS